MLGGIDQQLYDNPKTEIWSQKEIGWAPRATSARDTQIRTRIDLKSQH
jgi:hypothetical protein